jgi:Domain of unknown function (DUF4157)
LPINKPGDEYEQEANRIAEQVMAMPTRPGVNGALPRIERFSGQTNGQMEAAPAIVDQAVASPGHPLEPALRRDMEQRFGHDFARVRIHAGERAADAADALRAHAFSVGDHVAFAEGRYAPATQMGRRLLAHELAHIVQQTPNRVGPHAGVVHRQPAPTRAGMTRVELARRLKAIYGHDVTIEVGDKARQARELDAPSNQRNLPDTWREWDPGASTPLYDEILRAVEDFGREVGGVPNIGHVVFYEVRYVYDDQNRVVVADDKAAAEIDRKHGAIRVYKSALYETKDLGPSSFQRSGEPFASKRSTRGEAAPQDFGTRAQSQRHAIAHELGHGVERATSSLSEFEQAVGWVRGALYDIQAKGVKEAIEAIAKGRGAEPPAAARITKQNWNSGAHLEQPMSEYAVTSSTEDFAESITAWLYARDVLKARSPARFKFFDDQDRRKSWLPKLVTPGATPAPT